MLVTSLPQWLRQTSRVPALVIFLGASSMAPFQCASEPDTTRVKEETPGEALHDLANEFAKAGDKEGQIRTLRYLAERYPRSKFAEEAKVELRELGVELDAEAPASSSPSASAPSASAPSASAPSASSAKPP